MRGWMEEPQGGGSWALCSCRRACAEVDSCVLGRLVEWMLWFLHSLPPQDGTGQARQWLDFITSRYVYGWGSAGLRCYSSRVRMWRSVSNNTIYWQDRTGEESRSLDLFVRSKACKGWKKCLSYWFICTLFKLWCFFPFISDLFIV